MNDLYANIVSLPIWLRAVIWIGLIIFVAWPILRPIILRLIALVFLLFQGITRLIYVAFGWTLTSRLHKNFGGVFALADNKFNDFLGTVDSASAKIKRFFLKRKKIHVKIMLVLYLVLVFLIAFPDMINVTNDSPIRAVQTLYVNAETGVFGQSSEYIRQPSAPATVETNKATNTVTPTPSPIILTVVGIKTTSHLAIRKEPDLSSETLESVQLGDKLVYLNETKTNNGESWVHVESTKGVQGWARQQYLSKIP